jgi:hypothetical protein
MNTIELQAACRQEVYRRRLWRDIGIGFALCAVAILILALLP